MISSTSRLSVGTPSASNCSVRAVSSDGEFASPPVDRSLDAVSAATCDATKISAVTTTEPAVRVRVTALVETPAAAASTALIEFCAAES